MRIAIESAEIATLKSDGRTWDGPSGPRIPKAKLEAFFALDLHAQLDRLVDTGEMPNPPDVFVRLYQADRLLLESGTQESYEPVWKETATEVAARVGEAMKIEVWDRDLLFHDLIGETMVFLPAPVGDGRWWIAPFGQVRRLILRLG